MPEKKYKYRYKHLEDRSWGSLEADGRTQREANIEASKRASAMLADDAFSNDVPDDLDKHGSIDIQPTHVASHSVLEE